MYIVVLSHLFPLHLCSRRLELLQLLIWLGATTCDPLLRKYHRHRFVALLDCYPIQFGTIVIDTRVGIWLRQITALIPTVELDLHKKEGSHMGQECVMTTSRKPAGYRTRRC